MATVLQETEIEAARWLPLQEYQQQQLAFNGHLPLYQTMMDRCAGGGGGM